MKLTLYLFIYLFLTSFSELDNQKNEIDKIFAQTKKIEIYAYLVQYRWDRKDNKQYIINNKINIPEKYLRNKIELDKNQILLLKKSLKKSNDEVEENDCYDPRHTIVFYNEKNEIFGHVELCFSCYNSETSKNFKVLKDRMLFQEKLFKDFGITYFDDTKVEKDAFLQKQKEEMLELERKLKKEKE